VSGFTSSMILIATTSPVSFAIPLYTAPKDPFPHFSVNSNISAGST